MIRAVKRCNSGSPGLCRPVSWVSFRCWLIYSNITNRALLFAFFSPSIFITYLYTINFPDCFLQGVEKQLWVYSRNCSRVSNLLCHGKLELFFLCWRGSLKPWVCPVPPECKTRTQPSDAPGGRKGLCPLPQPRQPSRKTKRDFAMPFTAMRTNVRSVSWVLIFPNLIRIADSWKKCPWTNKHEHSLGDGNIDLVSWFNNSCAMRRTLKSVGDFSTVWGH